METKPSFWKGVLRMRCPYCREGRFYVSHPYDIKHAGDTLDECPVCHRSYHIEYGFFMGAMYVSYGISVFIGLLTYVLLAWLAPGLSIPWQIAGVALVTLGVAPLVYAYSKVIYGNIFLPFKGPSDPNYRPVRHPDAWK